MGELTIDQYYRKFLEYAKYCPDEVSIEEKNMLRFELGLTYEIQKLVDRYKYTRINSTSELLK